MGLGLRWVLLGPRFCSPQSPNARLYTQVVLTPSQHRYGVSSESKPSAQSQIPGATSHAANRPARYWAGQVTQVTQVTWVRHKGWVRPVVHPGQDPLSTDLETQEASFPNAKVGLCPQREKSECTGARPSCVSASRAVPQMPRPEHSGPRFRPRGPRIRGLRVGVAGAGDQRPHAPLPQRGWSWSCVSSCPWK